MPLPEVFLERIKDILPGHYGLEGCFQRPEKVWFRVNTLKVQPQQVFDSLSAQGVAFERLSWYASAFTVPATLARQVLDSPLGMEGQVYAQGLESMLPVLILDPKPGEAVLDLCAAPGSKTTQIAAHMQNQGTLVANETVKARFYRLKSVVELLGAKAKLTMNDGRYWRTQDTFDRILVDAPCSSEGRFKTDEPKSYGYWSLRKVHEMAHKQKGLLLNAGRLLKPGGTLVYSTCTFAPEENEAVIDWFLRKSEAQFKVEEVSLKGVAQYPALASWNDRPFETQIQKTLRVLPGSGVEGFFLAKLIRS